MDGSAVLATVYGAWMKCVPGMRGRWSPSGRKAGASGRDLDAVLPLPSACAADAASDAQHRTGGGNARSAAIAARICWNSARV
jgi:hypothetical protein